MINSITSVINIPFHGLNCLTLDVSKTNKDNIHDYVDYIIYVYYELQSNQSDDIKPNSIMVTTIQQLIIEVISHQIKQIVTSTFHWT